MRFLLWITGGRPMRRHSFMFTDVVSGRPVHAYEDRFGRWWLADDGPWSSFRVPMLGRPWS